MTAEIEQPLVLIADDESNAVMLLTRVLERDGFSVASARDGEEALEKARSLRPDLILMDVQMPELNGFEVVRLLREEAEPLARLIARDRPRLSRNHPRERGTLSSSGPPRRGSQPASR